MSLRNNIKNILKEHSLKPTVLTFQDSDVKILNRVLNMFLKNKYDWLIEIKVIFLENYLNHGDIVRMQLCGVIKVDEEWFAKQWREFHYSAPMPDPNQEDISFGTIIGGKFSWELYGDFKTAINLALPKEIERIELHNMFYRTEEKNDEMIKEEFEYTGDRSKIEKVVIKFINTFLKEKELPENFHSTVVDVFETEYGKACKITFLMKKPFSQDDSDKMFVIGRDVEKLIKRFFPNTFEYGTNTSNSTVSHYMSIKNYYESKKNQ